MSLYRPASQKMKQLWPYLADAVKIEYTDGKIANRVFSPMLAQEGRDSKLKFASMNLSVSESGSLRSKEAALLSSHMSMKPSDIMLQESLRESINASLRES